MRRNLLLLVFALMSCNALLAQDEFIIRPDTPTSRDKSSRFGIGPKIGAGLAMVTDPTSLGYDFDLQNGLTLQGGVVANLHFGRRLPQSPGGTGWIGAQAEVLYGLRTLGTDQQHLTMHCVEVPVLLQVFPLSSLDIEVGATFVKLLKCSPDMLQLGAHTVNVGQLAGANDVMLSFGASYKIPAGIMFDFRYNLSTSSLAGDFDSKVSSFTASIAYLITFGKK
jgi:hypothetical protein